MQRQNGFTLIELITVIVILGALAVVALPQYVDLQSEAEEASADGVYGAAQAAAAINFAAGVSGATQPAGGPIDDGPSLESALDGTPEGWEAFTGESTFCIDSSGDGSCTTADDTYVITVDTAESSSSKAVLSKSW